LKDGTYTNRLHRIVKVAPLKACTHESRFKRTVDHRWKEELTFSLWFKCMATPSLASIVPQACFVLNSPFGCSPLSSENWRDPRHWNAVTSPPHLITWGLPDDLFNSGNTTIAKLAAPHFPSNAIERSTLNFNLSSKTTTSKQGYRLNGAGYNEIRDAMKATRSERGSAFVLLPAISTLSHRASTTTTAVGYPPLYLCPLARPNRRRYRWHPT
jgi:hypothetical protein